MYTERLNTNEVKNFLKKYSGIFHFVRLNDGQYEIYSNDFHNQPLFENEIRKVSIKYNHPTDCDTLNINKLEELQECLNIDINDERGFDNYLRLIQS